MDTDKNGLRLLKSSQIGIRQLLFSRMTLILVLLIFRILLLITLFVWFEEYYIHYFGSTMTISVIMIFHLQNKRMESAVRTSWLVLIMVTPVFGTLLYLFTCLEIGQKLVRYRVEKTQSEANECNQQDEGVISALKKDDSAAASLCHFLRHQAGACVYQDTAIQYFSSGEQMLEAVLEQLENAKESIYLEYFIISEGEMWGRILEILARKAAEGVDVRVLYDGTCEFYLLPKHYPKRMEALGIQCKVFSPIIPIISTHYNFRDHRKIMVIDGHTAFTGGINLSDEYINVGSKYGHWKDVALMLRGRGAHGLMLLFLQMWNLDEKKYDFHSIADRSESMATDGYVAPFGDNPLDGVKIGQMVYMDLINRATRDICIMTPYLILDSEMENALCFAAQRGVRVRIILPGIPDKYIPYALAKTHYKALLGSGVEIYEYTPGFVHAKVVAVDADEAVVGTINFDYRSFYHHFECGVYMNGCSCITDILEDFESTVEKCRKVSMQTIKAEKWHRKLTGYLLKVIAPLL